MKSDLRNAFRTLRAAPGFTAVALVVLTLGIGATTAIYSVVDAVVLRGLPFDEADRLVAIREPGLKDPNMFGSVAPQDFADWKARQDVFTDMAASSGIGGFTIREGGRPEDLRVIRATANLFAILRVAPRIGHVFTTANEVGGNHRVALISDGLWRRRFAADPDVVGRTMTFDDGVWEIVGVMPPDFRYPVGRARATDMWVPYVVPASQKVRGNGRSYYLSVVARLRPGVTVAQAGRRMADIRDALAVQYPKWFADRGISVRTLHDSVVGDSVRSWMLMLLGAVSFVLLIACVNVANLLLARATARSREMGIRAALGATRWRLARASMVESLVLSGAGTVCGVVAAYWGVEVLRATLPASLPRLSSVTIDLPVLAAAAAAAIVTGVAFGLVPALHLSRPNVAGALREEGRSSTAGLARQRLRTTLIIAEVGLAVVLLVGSGLFVSSFVRLMNVDIGLDYHNLLTVSVYRRIDFQHLDRAGFEQAAARAGVTLTDVLARVRAVPGIDVTSALAGGLPLSGSWSRTSVTVPGNDNEFRGDDEVDIRQATADYLKATRLTLLAGRWIAATDGHDAAGVVVLNDEAVKRYLGGGPAVGRTIQINGTRTVIGVVRGVRLGGPETTVRPEAYVPMAQATILGADLVLRTHDDPLALVPAVKAAIWSVAPDLSIPEARTFEGMLGDLIAQRKFNMLLLSLFGLLAMTIASAGIYGVMAYVVEQRTPEIGVRMALGAQPGRILRMILGRAAAFVGVGLAAGLAGAWALSRLVGTFLFSVRPHDPAIYAGAAAVLMAAALVAALVPGLRAARIDPLKALR